MCKVKIRLRQLKKMGRPDNGLGKPGEKTKGFGLSAEAIAKLRQVHNNKISICLARLQVN